MIRAHAAILLTRVAGIAASDTPQTIFNDTDTHFSAAFINALVEVEVLTEEDADAEGNFRPDDPVTWDVFASWVERMATYLGINYVPVEKDTEDVTEETDGNGEAEETDGTGDAEAETPTVIASDWAKPEIEKAYTLGLVPDVLKDVDLRENINRAEFAAVVVKVFEDLASTQAIPVVNNPFTDTDDLEILKAYWVGAVRGLSGTIYGPEDLLTREQCATMLTRVFKRIAFAGWTYETDGDFTLDYTMPEPFTDDADISDYARESVYFMVANNILKGYDGYVFAPKNSTPKQEAEGYANTTREVALAIAVRMIENLKK